MLSIKCDRNYQPERKYICDVFFREFLGIDYSLEFVPGCREWIFTFSSGSELVMPDCLFQTIGSEWLKSKSLPVRPLSVVDCSQEAYSAVLSDSSVPIIYGDVKFSGSRPVDGSEGISTQLLPFDILGSAFFMLTRYEEAVEPDLDSHERFLAHSSLAQQEGFLMRPIVNEYLEILWFYMEKFDSSCARKKRISRVLVSCDVDYPFSPGVISLYSSFRSFGGDLLKRRNLRKAIYGLYNNFMFKKGHYDYDLNFKSFDWMMDVNENVGNKVTFFFMACESHSGFDGCYNIDDPAVLLLLRKVYERGHSIGLHPSYHSCGDVARMDSEFKRLKNVLSSLGLDENNIPSRQHFLRWDPLCTPRNQNKVGICCDSTLTYADHVGFRCGVCYEFAMFDLKNREVLSIYQRPLVVMEGAVFNSKYMNLDYGFRTFAMLDKLKRLCRMYDGDFTILWHNNHLLESKDKEFYKELIK